jgi:DNA-binding protein HU-beta
VTAHLKKGANLQVSGLGAPEVRKRAARIGRNPATGEAFNIKASKKVAFRPKAMQALRSAISGARVRIPMSRGRAGEED